MPNLKKEKIRRFYSKIGSLFSVDAVLLYLYTSDYQFDEEFANTPTCRLLAHVFVYQYANRLDIPGLKEHAMLQMDLIDFFCLSPKQLFVLRRTILKSTTNSDLINFQKIIDIFSEKKSDLSAELGISFTDLLLDHPWLVVALLKVT